MAMKTPLYNNSPGVVYSQARSPQSAHQPLCRGPARHTYIPLPPVHDHGYQCHTTLTSIHPLLQSTPHSAIKFDLHNHPSTIPIPPHTLAQPATNPPLPCLNISTHLLPWSIVVLPSQPHLPNAFVTVSDVLCALHHRLSLAATPEELCLLTPDVRSEVKAVFERRVQSHTYTCTREWETRLGIRRIDLLMSRTRFRGLSIVGNSTDVVVLDLC